MQVNRFEKHPIFWFFLFGVFVCFAVLFCDQVLRHFFWPTAVSGKRNRRFHHEYVANQRAWIRWEGKTYPIFTNSLGFLDSRNRMVPLQSVAHRILFLGDSFIAGVGCSYENSAVGRFAARIDPNVYEVLNAAATSYSPTLYYQKLSHILEDKKLKIDEVFVFVDISDIQDEIWYRSYRPSSYSFAWFLYDSYKYLEERSFFINRASGFVHALLTRQKVTDLEEIPPAKWVFSGDRMRWTDDPDIFALWGKEGLDRAARSMERLCALCRQHKIKLTLVVYPWPYQIWKKDLHCLQAVYWKKFADAADIGFLDLFPAFIQGKDADVVIRENFIPENVHWNERGQALVAEKLFDYYMKEKNRLLYE